MEILYVGESREPQAGRECADGQGNGAHKRPLAQAEDGPTEGHNLSMYSVGTLENVRRRDGGQPELHRFQDGLQV